MGSDDVDAVGGPSPGLRARARAGLGLRGKLFGLSIALILAGLLGAQVYVSRALDRDLDARARDELGSGAALAAAAVRHANAFDPAGSNALVRELSSESRARVTLIDPAGRVVADSSVPPERVAAMDNHALRPEVRAARETGGGTSVRQSGTLHEPLIYVARRLRGPEGGPWVVRLAIAPHSLEATKEAATRLLVVGGLLGLLAAALLSSVAVSLVTRPARRLAATARAMVSDLSLRTGARPDDEVGELAGALDELADARAASLESLGSERDRLGAILEAMAEGVLVTDARGTIVVANRALREMFMLPRDVVGRLPVEAIRNAELHESVAAALSARAPVSREIAVGGLRPRTVIARLAPVDDGTNGTVAVLTDVTDLRRLETVRRDFVANVSHELRTPVAAVIAAAETLREGALAQPAEAAEFVAIIERHAHRLRQLVEDLLDLSRIESRELKLALEPVDPVGAMERAAELFRLAAERKRIALRVEPPPSPLPPVRADRRALEQILSNLIDNAIKYSPEGRAVSLRAEPRPGPGGSPVRVRFTVRDEGAGIEARHLPRIFERFYRVDAGRSRQVGGTGLGLAIVKHLAEALGGEASVESTVGRGTEFRVDLPAA